MILIDAQHPRLPEPCVTTIGFFDGVHEGHRSLLAQVCVEAARTGLRSAVITFDRHPRQVLQSDFVPQLLTTPSEKIELLRTTGVDYCLLLPFTRELAELSARRFMEVVVQRQCNARTLLIGYDHRFGHDRSAGFEDYLRYGREINLSVLQATALYHDTQAISSSYIRRLLQESGSIDTATKALGYHYSLTGKVVHGYRQGHKLGFPTANIESNPEKLLPADGVYAVSVLLTNESVPRPGVLNIGCRPTLHNGINRTVEVHIPQFTGDLYDTTLQLSFLQRLRPQQKFSSLEALSTQIARDTEQAVQVFSLLIGG